MRRIAHTTENADKTENNEASKQEEVLNPYRWSSSGWKLKSNSKTEQTVSI